MSRRHRAAREGEPPKGVDGTRRAEARNQAANEGEVRRAWRSMASGIIASAENWAAARGMGARFPSAFSLPSLRAMQIAVPLFKIGNAARSSGPPAHWRPMLPPVATSDGVADRPYSLQAADAALIEGRRWRAPVAGLPAICPRTTVSWEADAFVADKRPTLVRQGAGNRRALQPGRRFGERVSRRSLEAGKFRALQERRWRRQCHCCSATGWWADKVELRHFAESTRSMMSP